MGCDQLVGQEFVGPFYRNRAVGIASRLGLMTTYRLAMWLYFYRCCVALSDDITNALTDAVTLAYCCYALYSY